MTILILKTLDLVYLRFILSFFYGINGQRVEVTPAEKQLPPPMDNTGGVISALPAF